MADLTNGGYCITTTEGDGMGTISSERPPMDQDARECNEKGAQGKDEEKNMSALKSAPGNGQQKEREPEKTQTAQPEKCIRVKKRCVWIKRNCFNLLLTIFTGLYAVGFLYDAYITKRAYLIPEREVDGGHAVSVLLNDAGIRVSFRNTGLTPATEGIFQAWFLKEKEVVQIEEVDPHVIRQTVAAGRNISFTMRWKDAPEDIVLIKDGTKGFRMIVRLRYKDVFGIKHCEEFAAGYAPDLGEFTETFAPPICDSNTRGVRFNRVCIPSADKTFGVWVETVETFDGRGPGGPVPNNDPTPCRNKNQQ